MLSQDLLEELDHFITVHLISYIENAYKRGKPYSRKQIRNLVKQIPFLSYTYNLYKNRVISRVLRECRSRAKQKKTISPSSSKKYDPVMNKKREYHKLFF